MAAEKTSALITLLLLGIGQLVFALALFAWGRWVGRRQGGAGWRCLAWVPLIAGGIALTGIAWSSVYFARAFDAVETADASMKATLLAENISSAMNTTAWFALPTWALYLACIIAFFVGSLRRPRATPSTTP
jgi:hypothetical protein